MVSRGGRILRESFARDFDAHQASYPRFLLKHAVRLTVKVERALWITDNLSPGSYFHWMTECLPRLLLGERSAPVVLLPAAFREQPFVPYTLAAFPTAVGWLGRRVKARVGELVLPLRREPGVYGPELRKVADRLRVETHGPERVYFARESGRRRIVNERDVARLLASEGFERVAIDPSRPADQVRVASGASMIIGPHGAALTNAMFMRSGRLIELRHGGHTFWDCFGPLAESFGIGYTPLVCDTRGRAEGYEINHLDLQVDLDRLRAALSITVAATAG